MADTSTKQTYALSTDEIKHVAEQVGKQVIMGPAYYDPELIDRMGIQVISGVQFKKVDTLLVRQGGTTRRKVVGKPVSNKIGILKERTLEAKLSWNRFTDNIDRYVETVFGTDGKPGGDYPFSTTAAEAIMRTYAEDLTANLFFGDGDNDVYAEKERKGETLTPEEKEKAKLSLYNGFHTNINLDIADGIISEANHNIIPCEAIAAPADDKDSAPFDTVLEWYAHWDARLRQQRDVRLYCDVLRGIYIAAGYLNKYHGNSKVNYLPNGNFTVPEMPHVQFVPSDVYGTGTRLMASVVNNLQYGVDSLNNQTFVKTQFGSDNDAQDVIFQIQSIQGTRLMNPLPSAFVMSDGGIQPNNINGDYDNSFLTVTADSKMGSVTVNGEAYTKPKEFAANDIITLEAKPAEGYVFTNWSNGKTDAKITITANGMPMAITALFKANA